MRSLNPALRGALPAVVGALVATSACRPPREPPICAEEVAAKQSEDADTRLWDLENWVKVLIQGVARQRPLTLPEEPRDCSGQRLDLDWDDPAIAAADRRLTAEPLPWEPPTEEAVIQARGPEGDLLIWLALERFDDGTVRGPVARARAVERGVEIWGIGTLWAPAIRPRIHLEALPDDGWLLVAEGRTCRDCPRELVLMPLVGQRFVAAGLIEGEARGPARIATYERREEKLEDGWIRREEVRRSLRFADPTKGRITAPRLAEEITVRECPGPREERRPPTEDAADGSAEQAAAASGEDDEACVDLDQTSNPRSLRWDPEAAVFRTEPSRWATTSQATSERGPR